MNAKLEASIAELLPEIQEVCNEVNPLYFVLEKTSNSVYAFDNTWSKQEFYKIKLEAPLHLLPITVSVDKSSNKVEVVSDGVSNTLLYAKPMHPDDKFNCFIGLETLLESETIYGQPRESHSFLQPAIERISAHRLTKESFDRLLDKIREERGFVNFIVASPKFYGAIIEALSNELTEITIGKKTVKCYYDIIIVEADLLSNKAYFLNTRYIKIARATDFQPFQVHYSELAHRTEINLIQRCNLICTNIDKQTIIKGDNI